VVKPWPLNFAVKALLTPGVEPDMMSRLEHAGRGGQRKITQTYFEFLFLLFYKVKYNIISYLSGHGDLID
jgi:hypothetical protein